MIPIFRLTLPSTRIEKTKNDRKQAQTPSLLDRLHGCDAGRLERNRENSGSSGNSPPALRGQMYRFSVLVFRPSPQHPYSNWTVPIIPTFRYIINISCGDALSWIARFNMLIQFWLLDIEFALSDLGNERDHYVHMERIHFSNFVMRRRYHCVTILVVFTSNRRT